MSSPREPGDSVGVFEGSGTGTGFLDFLLDRGIFTAYRLNLKADAEFVVKRGEERLLEKPFVFSLTARVTLADALGY